MALDSILSTPVAPPPKPASSNSSSSSSAAHSSFAADSNSGSSSAAQSSSSSNGASTSDNGNATRNAGKNASSRNNASSSQAQGQTQNASGSHSKQSNSATQTPSAKAASNGKDGAAQTSKTPGASFLQALAQTQADTQDSVSATATGAPQAVTGKGKGKSTKDDGSTDPSASLGFLSQSLVAAMAGIQQPSPTQDATAGTDSVDGVSLSSGTSAQTLVATLMQNTADDLQAAGGSGSKPDAGSNAATTTPAADANAAASAFQSHLGVSSHLQASATQETANSQVNTPVGANGFADEVGDKITWMAHQGVQSASLKMTPENMGPVEVRISVQDGSATVAFNAAHADTRAALEQALPRLREMFSTQGLNLSDASVSQQFSRGQPQKQAIGAIGSVGSVSDETTSSVVSVASARLGLVDTYA